MALSVTEAISYMSVTTNDMQRRLIKHFYNYANKEDTYFRSNWKQTQSRCHTRRHLRIAYRTADTGSFFHPGTEHGRFYRKESLHPPGHLARVAVPRTATKADRIRDSHTGGGTLTMSSASVLNISSDEYDILTTCWIRRIQREAAVLPCCYAWINAANWQFCSSHGTGPRQTEIWNILEQWFPNWGTHTPRGTNQDI